MSFYDVYKPLRNFVRKLSLQQELIHIWQLSQNISNGLPLPPAFNIYENQSVKGEIHPWELEILAREVVLEAGEIGKKELLNTNDLSIAIGCLRKIVNEQSRLFLQEHNVMHEMHRVSQQQFPWQIGMTTKLARFYRIFKNTELEPILIQATGLGITKILQLGFCLCGMFRDRPTFNVNTDFSIFGISNEERDAFFKIFSLDLETLRQRTRDQQEYNENWCYTVNPLIKTPLIKLSLESQQVVCPIPEFILTGMTEGLVFDIYRVRGYEKPYGNAYEEYVFGVTELLLNGTEYSVEKGSEYYVGRNKKDGVDLILHNQTSAMLIECKAKRLNKDSKFKSDGIKLDSDLSLLAKFIVQNYKNIDDINNGHTPWDVRNRSLFPIILTLMECYIWTPEMRRSLGSLIDEKLKDAGVSVDIVTRYPFTIMCNDEYEIAIQLIQLVGMEVYFGELQKEEFTLWSINSIHKIAFKDILSKCKTNYFDEDYNNLINSFGKIPNVP